LHCHPVQREGSPTQCHPALVAGSSTGLDACATVFRNTDTHNTKISTFMSAGFKAMLIENKEGRTPLDYAIIYGASNVIDAALKAVDGSNISSNSKRYKQLLGKNKQPKKPRWPQLQSWLSVVDLQSDWVTVDHSELDGPKEAESPPVYTQGVGLFDSEGGAAGALVSENATSLLRHQPLAADNNLIIIAP
jgi:hypothetical protein